MSLKLRRKYFSIVFILAVFMGVFHHHHDLKQHNDCQICTIQTNMANADMPSEAVYLSSIDIFYENIVTKLINSHTNKLQNKLQARAPPKIS